MEYIDKGWYKFNLDGNEFECKWSSISYLKNRNTATNFGLKIIGILEKAGYCYEYGIDVDRVKICKFVIF